MRPGRPNCASSSPVWRIERADLPVGAVGDEDVALRRVLRQHQVPDRAVLQRLRLDAEFLHEGAVLAEHLDAVVGAVADIDEAVARQAHAVHRVGERLRQRAAAPARRAAACRRSAPCAVGAPVALVGAGLGIEHDDAAVAVAVGHVELVAASSVTMCAGRPSRVLLLEPPGRAGLADLPQEFAVGRELQDLVVVLAVAGEPDVAVLVDVDAVLVLGPVVARARAAPAG